jgi:hypothetical protein
MTIPTQNIDVMPVLEDAGVEFSQLKAIEIAPLPKGGIHLVDTGSELMWENNWQKHRLYLCQEGTGFFCEITTELEDGRIGAHLETLTPGPEDIYVNPEPFFKDGIDDDDAVIVLQSYAEETHTGTMDFGTRITIYTPQPKNEMSQKERESKIEALGLWGVVGEIEISDQELDELLENQNNRIVNYNSITEEQLEKEMAKGTPGAREAWLKFLKDDLGEEEFETYTLENDLA